LRDLVIPSEEKEKRAGAGVGAGSGSGSRNLEESLLKSQEISAKRESESRSPIRRGNSERSPLRRDNNADRSPGRSPLRSKVSFERKLSGSSYANSPSKRRQVSESYNNIADREVPDVAYYNAQVNHLNNVIVNQTSKLAVK